MREETYCSNCGKHKDQCTCICDEALETLSAADEALSAGFFQILLFILLLAFVLWWVSFSLFISALGFSFIMGAFRVYDVYRGSNEVSVKMFVKFSALNFTVSSSVCLLGYGLFSFFN